MRRNLYTRLSLLAEDEADNEETTNTDEVIEEETEEPKDEKKEEKNEKEESSDEEETYTPEEEPGGEDPEDGDEGEGDEEAPTDDTPPSDGDDLGGTEPDDTPAEEKPRHDTGVNSTDIVVNASNVIRAAGEMTQSVASEDMRDHSDIELLYSESDSQGQTLGHIALELDQAQTEVENLCVDCKGVGEAFDVLNEENNEGFNSAALESIGILMAHIRKNNGLHHVSFKGIARESLLQRRTDLGRKSLALEGLGDMFRAMIDAVCDAFRRLWNWIKSFFSAAKEKQKSVSKTTEALENRTEKLQKRYAALNEEKRNVVKNLFAVCQKYDPSNPGTTLSDIPDAVKNKEEKIKQDIQLKGFRLKQEDLNSFVICGVFINPSENKELINNLSKTAGLFGDLCRGIDDILEKSDALFEAIEVDLKDPSNVDKGSLEGDKSQFNEPVNKAIVNFGNSIHYNFSVNKTFEAFEDSQRYGLNQHPSDSILVNKGPKEMDGSLASLPENKIVVCTTIKQENVEASKIVEILGELKMNVVSFVTQSGTSGFVNHTEFDVIKDNIEYHISHFDKHSTKIMNEIEGSMKNKASRLEEKLNKLKNHAGGFTAGGNCHPQSKRLIEVLNKINLLISNLVGTLIPAIAKLFIAFSASYNKYINASLNAFELCLDHAS